MAPGSPKGAPRGDHKRPRAALGAPKSAPGEFQEATIPAHLEGATVLSAHPSLIYKALKPTLSFQDIGLSKAFLGGVWATMAPKCPPML